MRTVIVAAALASITGCAVQKDLVPTGGSRADGVVELSYDYGLFESPQVDYEKGGQSAAESCAAWGFSGARAFGGGTDQCVEYSADNSCNRHRVTHKYQCID